MAFIGSERPYKDGPRQAVLRLTAKFPYHDGHGSCFHLHDPDGNLFVWFSKKHVILEVGTTVRASFVIQSHKEYEGMLQNVTQQFRILEVLATFG